MINRWFLVKTMRILSVWTSYSINTILVVVTILSMDTRLSDRLNICSILLYHDCKPDFGIVFGWENLGRGHFEASARSNSESVRWIINESRRSHVFQPRDYFETAHKLNFRPFRGLIQFGAMECNITKGGRCQRRRGKKTPWTGWGQREKGHRILIIILGREVATKARQMRSAPVWHKRYRARPWKAWCRLRSIGVIVGTKSKLEIITNDFDSSTVNPSLISITRFKVYSNFAFTTLIIIWYRWPILWQSCK